MAQTETNLANAKGDKASVEIVFESDTLRVLMVTMPPGSRTKRIAYTSDYMVVPLTDGTVTRVVHDGDVVRREVHHAQLGRPYLRPASENNVDHYFINDTQYEIRFEKVEVKALAVQNALASAA